MRDDTLTGKHGGENEKLIFKIMKRGEKLANASSEDELCDSGLRYDLTVPLSRYYAANRASLPTPFKVIQTDRVFRAERPQKGRMREFVQCDIDILGDATQTAEITLISSTAGVLRKLGFDNFTIRINDRRMLKLCAEACGFAPEEHDKVFIILDKMDKIGLEGVKNELLAEGYDENCVSKYIALYDGCDTVTVEDFASSLGEAGAKIASDLSTIMRCASAATVGGCKLAFDPTLVRGMSYYTGTIFEIRMDGYGYSVGGGGRYDIGMMQYGMQIWTSDNTNPYDRTYIQASAMMGYPAATMSCHVSNPHESLESLDYRYKVAVGGMLGYELNILNMSEEIKRDISAQIAQYKSFDHVMRLGEYYNLAFPTKYDYSAYYYTTEDASEIVLTVIEKDGCKKGTTKKLRVKVADADASYTDACTGKTYSGEELRSGITVELLGERDSAHLFLFKKA